MTTEVGLDPDLVEVETRDFDASRAAGRRRAVGLELCDTCACYVEDGVCVDVGFGQVTRIAGEDICVVAGGLAAVDLVGACEWEK